MLLCWGEINLSATSHIVNALFVALGLKLATFICKDGVLGKYILVELMRFEIKHGRTRGVCMLPTK